MWQRQAVISFSLCSQCFVHTVAMPPQRCWTVTLQIYQALSICRWNTCTCSVSPLLSISSASSRTNILMARVLRLLRRIISAGRQQTNQHQLPIKCLSQKLTNQQSEQWRSKMDDWFPWNRLSSQLHPILDFIILETSTAKIIKNRVLIKNNMKSSEWRLEQEQNKVHWSTIHVSHCD